MAILKIILILSITFSAQVFADKESEKSRLDDCFYEVQQMLNVMNSMQGTSEGPAFNRKFMNKKARCHELKGSFEKKHGKYTIRGTEKRPQSKIDIKEVSIDEITTAFCNVEDGILSAEEQMNLQKDNANSVNQYKSIIAQEKDRLEKIRALYKQKVGSNINEDICYIKIFSSIKGRDNKPFLEDSMAINKYFCRLETARAKDFLNRTQKNLSGEEAHCAK